ncbi:O-succinylbenzoic acid--CoA ligase [Salinimicrobium sediminis]|uniref:O-succinylbenzoic acid--CoA ligase n=1 Tax=Salinimicrobium sediminis TaxID=1343891 RepID=A0A285X5C3_9FLAO|nr:AMP-binding protein [Salinimicrobium sediminis]SOC80531.1 O-succinylbenzoic acid--CoA ligase [Salinimicrobium sediminis]
MQNEFSLPETHPDFRLNGLYYTNEDLAAVAYSLIKEGEPYEGQAGNFLLDWLNDKDYVEVKTSGSTGPPKRIRIRKQQMINSARATGKFFDLGPGTTALHCLPVNFIAGKMMLVRAMLLGWKLDLELPKANPLDRIFKIYDFCAMTPFQLDNSLSRLHLIKKLIVGGGAVSSNLRNLVQEIGTEVYETYGMTETVSHIAARHVNPKKKIKEDPVPFTVLPNVSISTDDRGCLVIDAPQLTDETLITNDVVELLSEKTFIWKGRIDNVINSGGVKLHPEEIEAKLAPIIAHRFFVTSLPDAALGEKLVLMVESEFSEVALNNLEREIKACRKLGKFEVPKKIYFVEKFEETPNGKIHRANTLKSRMA